MYNHVFNITDTVKGSMHQVTVESSGAYESRPFVRIDGNILPYDHEFRAQVLALIESFEDHFAGLEGDISEVL